MGNMQVIYYLNNGQSYFFRQRDKSLVSDKEIASRWPTKRAAQKVLNSLPNKELPTKTRIILPELKVGDVNQLKTNKKIDLYTIEDLKLIDDIVEMDQEEFILLIEKFVKILGLIPAVRTNISQKISQEDSDIVQDFLHTIEFGKFNASEGYKIAKEFQKSRQKRRDMKDRFEILSTLITFNCGMAEINSNTVKKAQKLISGLKKREYAYRSEDVKEKFSYLIKR